MMDRTALIIEDTIPVNAVVLGEGAKGDEWLEANPNAVEVTNLNPMPGLGNGWTYINNEWIAPLIVEPEPDPIREASIEKLRGLGFSDQEIKSLFGIEVE